MTKTKSTKRAFLSAVLALIVCVSMLIGTTFAWFTDSVTSSGNKIIAGNLKLDLELLDKDGNWNSIKEDQTALFNYDRWEPGYTDVKVLKVENEGSLALKWIAKFASENKLSALADVIDVYVCPSATELTYPADRSLDGYTRVGTVADFVNTIEETTYGYLEAYESAYLGIALKMQESAGNKYQGMDLGGVFDIMILATQNTVESDSFDDQYDANAKYDINNVYIGSVKYDSIADAIAAANDGDTIRLTAGTFYEALDLQGKSLTIQGASKASTIIAGPEHYTTTNIPMQTWAGWGGGQDANVYALISADKDVTIKDLTVSGNPKEISEVAEFRHQGDCAFVGIHVQSANATIENVNIKGIKPTNVTGNDHHNFGLYITSAINNSNTYTVTYKNGTVSDVNRGGIYCWGDRYTLKFEDVTVIGPGNINDPNGTLMPAVGSETVREIYAFAPFYVESSAQYKDVVIRDSWCVAWWGGASWAWANPGWSTNPPAGVTCINCGTAN